MARRAEPVVRVGIAACGTRGDVDPFMALGHALAEAGHEVLLAAPNHFAALARRMGFRFTGIDFDVQAVLRASGGAAAARRRSPGIPGFKELFSRASESMGRGVLAVAEDCDVLVSAIGIDDYALAAAQARKLPAALGERLRREEGLAAAMREIVRAPTPAR